jgi:hypothetical protein
MAMQDSREHPGRAQLRLVEEAPSSQPVTELTPPKWLTAAEDHSIALHPGRLRLIIEYFLTGWRLPRAIVYWVWRGLCGVTRECTYPWSGTGKVIDAVYGWQKALDYEQAAKDAAETKSASKASTKLANVRSRRFWILFATGVIILGLGLWIYFYHWHAGLLTAIGIICVLDQIGRKSRPKPEKLPRNIKPLVEGIPPNALKQQLEEILTREGYGDFISVSDVILDPFKYEYKILVATNTEVEPKLLRQIERGINAPPNSIKTCVDEENSAIMTWTVKLRNTLANVPEAPWRPAGSLSAWEPVDLGVAYGDQPFELVFAGTHVIIDAKTGGGKTKVHIANIIDRLSACRDAVIWGIDIQNGPAFPMWRSVVQEKAFTVDEADALLDKLLTEMNRRKLILHDIATDDDPTNDTDEWVPSLGPALIIIIDEFPQLSKWDGTKLDLNGDKPNLLAKAEDLYRMGRKFGISLVIGIQKTGLKDTGSSVVSTQSAVWIVGPCDERDTVDVFGTAKRDAGYAPHLFKPATFYKHNDAGMALVSAPGFGIDPVRGYKPFRVKPRAARREQEWIELGNKPTLDYGAEAIDAVTVPPGLAAVEAALNYYQVDILNTQLTVEHANKHGGRWTTDTLSEAVKQEAPQHEIKRSGRCRILNKGSPQSYHRAELEAALRDLGVESP